MDKNKENKFYSKIEDNFVFNPDPNNPERFYLTGIKLTCQYEINIPIHVRNKKQYIGYVQCLRILSQQYDEQGVTCHFFTPQIEPNSETGTFIYHGEKIVIDNSLSTDQRNPWYSPNCPEEYFYNFKEIPANANSTEPIVINMEDKPKLCIEQRNKLFFSDVQLNLYFENYVIVTDEEKNILTIFDSFAWIITINRNRLHSGPELVHHCGIIPDYKPDNLTESILQQPCCNNSVFAVYFEIKKTNGEPTECHSIVKPLEVRNYPKALETERKEEFDYIVLNRVTRFDLLEERDKWNKEMQGYIDQGLSLERQKKFKEVFPIGSIDRKLQNNSCEKSDILSQELQHRLTLKVRYFEEYMSISLSTVYNIPFSGVITFMLFDVDLNLVCVRPVKGSINNNKNTEQFKIPYTCIKEKNFFDKTLHIGVNLSESPFNFDIFLI